MGTIPTKISNVSLNLKEQTKKVLSENISTETKEKIAQYEEYKRNAIENFKETEFYNDLKETINKYESEVSEKVNVEETNAEQTTNATSIIEETVVEPVDNTPKSGTPMKVPSGDTSFKSYTNYKKVTNKSTPAYAVVNGLTSPYGKFAGTTYNTKTDPETGVRYVTFEGDSNKYYCAAMGTYYGEVGDTFKVTTDEGNTYNVIMCDAKGSDAQGKIDGKTWYHSSGSGKKCVTEFYMEYPAEEMKVYDSRGNYKGTTGTYDSVSQFSGNIVSVEKLS